MSKVTDLDPYMSEMLGEGARFRLYGVEWQLKPEMPTLLMLRIRQEMENPDEETKPEDEIALLRALLDPPEQADSLLEAGLGRAALLILIRVALAIYMGVDPKSVLDEAKAGDQGEAEGAETPPPSETSSSSSGRGSKRISKQSTD